MTKSRVFLIDDHGVLHAERAPHIILALLEVRFMEGGRDLYLLPATFHPVAAPGSGPEPIVTHATLRGEARVVVRLAHPLIDPPLTHQERPSWAGAKGDRGIWRRGSSHSGRLSAVAK